MPSYKLQHNFRYWIIPLLLFSVAFPIRAIYPVSRPMQWYNRAIPFMDAVLTQDWAGTYQRSHPGVTTMWIAGTGIKLYASLQNISSNQLLGLAPSKPGTVDQGVTAGVIALALVISLCIGLIYILLRRITNEKIAFIGGLFLAFDPFYITHSKVLHVDALLSTFMITSALFLFDYTRKRRRSALIGSGIFAGLSLLTKTPSLFLIPYAALVLGVGQIVTQQIVGLHSRTERVTWHIEIIHRICWLAIILLVWSCIAILTFVLLWPAMWVEPLHALEKISGRSRFHITTPNLNPVFFNDDLVIDDPGLPFYLATIAWKTTSVTLSMIGIGLISTLLRRPRSEYNRMIGLLAAYVICFTIPMGLSARKATRYLLPVFPAIDILAAFGITYASEALGRIDWKWARRWYPNAFVFLLIALQTGLVLRHHPYYGTHHNYLLGGSQVAQHVLPLQDEAEGLDLAARYLNNLPRASQASASVHPLGAEPFGRVFIGKINYDHPTESDYRIYYVNQVTRHLGGKQWMDAWEQDQAHEPLWTIGFDGITYVWIYGEPPPKPAAGGPERELDCRLGEHITLKRVRLNSQQLVPGDLLIVVPTWESDGQVQENYMAFCHVLSADGQLVAQMDGPPVHGTRPTPSWRAGEIIEDVYYISLDDDLSEGDYELSIGMYDLQSMERAPAYDASGERFPEDRIILETLSIISPDD